MTRTQFLRFSLTAVAGVVSGAVLARSIQVFRPRRAATPRADFTHYTNAELLGEHQAMRLHNYDSDTLVIWVDYACPACRILQHRLGKEKLNPRKLRIVYRNRPLKLHPTAFDLATTVEAASEQRAVEAVRYWISENLGYGPQGKLDCLKALGVDLQHWKKATEAARVRVARDDSEAQGFGINATPAMILLSDKPPREVMLSDLTAYK